MPIFDFLTGSKSPAPGTALLALNRDTAPWQVRYGETENINLVAEWKIVDSFCGQ